MAIANNNEEKPLIIYTFKKLCNGEQWLATQQYELIIDSCKTVLYVIKPRTRKKYCTALVA